MIIELFYKAETMKKYSLQSLLGHKKPKLSSKFKTNLSTSLGDYELKILCYVLIRRKFMRLVLDHKFMHLNICLYYYQGVKKIQFL
jgi:hypothetical protein